MEDSTVQGFGIAAGTLTSLSLIPQLVKLVREKKAENISVPYVIILLAGLCLWIAYGFLRKDIPVIATNIFSAGVGLTTLVLGIKYRRTSSM